MRTSQQVILSSYNRALAQRKLDKTTPIKGSALTYFAESELPVMNMFVLLHDSFQFGKNLLPERFTVDERDRPGDSDKAEGLYTEKGRFWYNYSTGVFRTLTG